MKEDMMVDTPDDNARQSVDRLTAVLGSVAERSRERSLRMLEMVVTMQAVYAQQKTEILRLRGRISELENKVAGLKDSVDMLVRCVDSAADALREDGGEIEMMLESLHGLLIDHVADCGAAAAPAALTYAPAPTLDLPCSARATREEVAV